MDKLKKLLMKHEGLRLYPYKDSVGKTTIGIGRNLDDVGISQEEALMLLEKDIKNAVREINANFHWWTTLNEARQVVLISMVFNMGMPRFKKFAKTIAAMERQEWKVAAAEMIDSKWASQVGSRATELADMMRYGVFTEESVG